MNWLLASIPHSLYFCLNVILFRECHTPRSILITFKKPCFKISTPWRAILCHKFNLYFYWFFSVSSNNYPLIIFNETSTTSVHRISNLLFVTNIIFWTLCNLNQWDHRYESCAREMSVIWTCSYSEFSSTLDSTHFHSSKLQSSVNYGENIECSYKIRASWLRSSKFFLIFLASFGLPTSDFELYIWKNISDVVFNLRVQC